MTAARLAARCVELLGQVEGPVVVVAPSRVADAIAAHLPNAMAAELPLASDGRAAGAVCVFLRQAVDPAARRETLGTLAARLPAGASLVVVDHNQPRDWWRRALGVVVLAARGLGASRARHPVAREVQERGFTVERLRLACGERVQLVLARRA